MNQKGMTILETIVGMLILSIIVTLSFKAYTIFTKNCSRSQQMTQMQMNSRDMLTVLVRDIRNTGCKYYMTQNGNTIDKHLVTAAFISDSSSFSFHQGNPSDTLKIYKARLSEIGEYLGADSTEFYLDGTTLVKKSNNKSIRLNDNVFALQFQYGEFASDSMLLDINPINFPRNWLVYSESGIRPTYIINGSQICFNFSGISKGMIYYNTSFSVDTQRINVTFNIDADPVFDSLHCSIMKNSTVNGTEKFLPQTHTQCLVVNTIKTSTAKLAFRYWSNSTGKLTIKGAEIKCNDHGKFIWYDSIPESKKKFVRAIKISILTRSKINAGIEENKPIDVCNVSINRSGKYEWNIRTESVETLNNGTF